MQKYLAHSSIPEWYATPEVIQLEEQRVMEKAIKEVAATLDRGQPYVITINQTTEQPDHLGDIEIDCVIEYSTCNQRDHVEIPPLGPPRPFIPPKRQRLRDWLRALFK